MGWKCRSCGYSNADDAGRCGNCNASGAATASRVYTRPAPGEPKPEPVRTPIIEVVLPAYLEDVRFSTGATWTHGALYARAEGLFLLSDSDGVADPQKAATRKPPEGDQPIVAGLSQWIPAAAIREVLHQLTTGYCIVLKDGKKVPVRLTSDGWGRLGGVCAKLGIPF
jgi:hypothetical protein